MTLYENLLLEADKEHLIVKEKPLRGNKGKILNDKIGISTRIKTYKEKAVILAEEIGHYHTGSGNINPNSKSIEYKYELKGRVWAYNKLIGLKRLIESFEHGCKNQYEVANYLDITESFLLEAISYYRNKYGTYTIYDAYIIYFIPNITIGKFYSQNSG